MKYITKNKTGCADREALDIWQYCIYEDKRHSRFLGSVFASEVSVSEEGRAKFTLDGWTVAFVYDVANPKDLLPSQHQRCCDDVIME